MRLRIPQKGHKAQAKLTEVIFYPLESHVIFFAKSSEIPGKVSSFICGTHALHLRDTRPSSVGRTSHK